MGINSYNIDIIYERYPHASVQFVENYLNKYAERTTISTKSEFIRKKIINFMVKNDFNISQITDISSLLEDDILSHIHLIADFSYRKICIHLMRNSYAVRSNIHSYNSIIEAIEMYREQKIDTIFLMIDPVNFL